MIVNCCQCKKDFNKRNSKVQRDENHFCSKICNKAHKLDKINSLIGKDFNNWTVKEFCGVTENGACLFKCECKCGKIKNIKFAALNNNKTTQCIRCSNRNYVGQVSGDYFNQIKWSAKSRKIAFNITQTDIWQQYLNQNKKCYYSGLDLIWKERGITPTASVDRKDSNIGYTTENIVICHKMINYMKRNYSEQEFIQMCKTITQHQEKSINYY